MWIKAGVSHIDSSTPFAQVKRVLGELLLRAPEVRVPEWQSLDVADKPQGITHELQNVVFSSPIPESDDWDEDLLKEEGVSWPWAEEQFQDRVSGLPFNPPPSAATWPYTQHDHKDVTDEDKQFSHTYPERMWPQYAPFSKDGKRLAHTVNWGIRYRFGDLNDLVDQLAKSPMTRQAFLPIWFPEDTGAVDGQRVPCSLGYHFLIRDGGLSVAYFIRSVDFIRHFPDDVYMAMRLGQWVRDRLEDIWGDTVLGMDTLTMHIVSLHIFGGDMPKMERLYGQAE